jgi:hypothetical protein
MAKETAATLFLGTDYEYPFTILNAAETAAINISGWTLSWMVKRKKTDTDANALLTKTTSSGITISGTWNTDPDVNTQVATVAVADTDTDTLPAGLGHYELKRTDAGSETVLAYGPLELKRSVHRA